MTHYGWKRSLPDYRDHVYRITRAIEAPLPTSIDLRPGMPAVYDQGQLGSCTANAIAAAVQFDEIRQLGQPLVMKPSRLFVYYNERFLEDSVDWDSGAEIRDGFKTIGSDGVCSEDDWPYDVSRFRDRPGLECYTNAVLHKAMDYARVVQSLQDMRSCLAEGFPFVVGFSVYDSFESDQVASNGIVPMPDPYESLLGGHAVVVVGYDDIAQRFLLRNSWGDGWGQAGYFTMPYEYLVNQNLADDFWVVRVVVT